MTRFLPIDRPLVYGDIVSYQPPMGTGTTGDRNMVLARVQNTTPSGMWHLLQIAEPGGTPEIELIMMTIQPNSTVWKLVEE